MILKEEGGLTLLLTIGRCFRCEPRFNDHLRGSLYCPVQQARCFFKLIEVAILNQRKDINTAAPTIIEIFQRLLWVSNQTKAPLAACPKYDYPLHLARLLCFRRTVKSRRKRVLKVRGFQLTLAADVT